MRRMYWERIKQVRIAKSTRSAALNAWKLGYVNLRILSTCAGDDDRNGNKVRDYHSLAIESMYMGKVTLGDVEMSAISWCSQQMWCPVSLRSLYSSSVLLVTTLLMVREHHKITQSPYRITESRVDLRVFCCLRSPNRFSAPVFV